MTRIINTALIGLVAFVVILAGLWLVVDPKAPSMATSSTQAGDIRLRATDVAWATGDGTTLDVELLLRNAGAAASVTQVAYRATLDGQLLAAATDDPPTSLPAQGDGPVRFTVRLPSDMARRVLDASQEGGDAVLRIDGTVAVRSAKADQRVTFDWHGALRPELAERLESSLQDCPGPPAPLCLEALEVDAANGRLEIAIRLRNDATDAVDVHAGTAALRLGGQTVAVGALDDPLVLDPGSTGAGTLRLAFDDAALAQWWAVHIAACERSELSLALVLGTGNSSDGTSEDAVAWDLRAAPLDTGMLCRDGVPA